MSNVLTDPSTVVVTVPTTPLNSANRPEANPVFTQADIDAAREQVRQQEKDKLYSKINSGEERIDALQRQLDAFNADKIEAERIATEAREQAESARKAREQEELSAKDLLLVKEQEFNQRLSTYEAETNARLAQIQQERDIAAALLQKSQEFQALETYKNRRLAEVQDDIMPELIDLVSGNTEDEIEASISTLTTKSTAMMEAIQQTTAPTPRLRGVPPTGGAPLGPLDNNTAQTTYTLDDIKNMSMEEFSKNRDALMAASRPRR